MMKGLAIVALVVLPSVTGFAEPPSTETNVYAGAGLSRSRSHGETTFVSLGLETLRRPPVVARFPRTGLGIAVQATAIREPIRFFGHQASDPRQKLYAASAFLFARHYFDRGGIQPFVELGSGPMVSTKKIPPDASRLNFESKLGIGAAFPAGRTPILINYHFSHISNASLAYHNQGLNVHSVTVGVRLGR